jgi:hypothetical protein
MSNPAPGAACLPELEEQLRCELAGKHIRRTVLSELEGQLAALLEDMQPRVEAATREHGQTACCKRARTALEGLRQSVEWARMYRCHAPLRQRSEYVAMGLECAKGIDRSLAAIPD